MMSKDLQSIPSPRRGPDEPLLMSKDLQNIPSPRRGPDEPLPKSKDLESIPSPLRGSDEPPPEPDIPDTRPSPQHGSDEPPAGRRPQKVSRKKHDVPICEKCQASSIRIRPDGSYYCNRCGYDSAKGRK